MRILLSIILLLTLAGTSLAGAYDTAYRQDAAYQTAERALATASEELAKVHADPGATPMQDLEAQERLSEARARLAGSEAQARQRVIIAWIAVLTARRQRDAAQAKAVRAHLQQAAAEARRSAGAISAQELARAVEAAASADTAAVEAGNALIKAELRARPYGAVPEETPGLPPTLDATRLSCAGHPDLLAARHRVSASERTLALAQGPDSSRLERQARERDVQNARDALDETARRCDEGLDAAARGVTVALDRFRLAEQSLLLATREMETSGKRFEAGAISRIALSDATITRLEASGQVESARSDTWQAYFTLLLAAGGGQ